MIFVYRIIRIIVRVIIYVVLWVWFCYVNKFNIYINFMRKVLFLDIENLNNLLEVRKLSGRVSI